MIERGLFQHLSANAGVAAIAAARIYPGVIPQGSVAPAVVYSRVGSIRGRTACATDSLVQASFQLDCYARNYFDATRLAAAVRAALVDFSGELDGTRVNRVFIETEFDTDDPEPGLYRVSQTYTVWYLEN